MRFPAGKVTMGEVTVQVLPFPPVGIVPPRLHTHVHPNSSLSEGQAANDREPSEQSGFLSAVGEIKTIFIHIYELNYREFNLERILFVCCECRVLSGRGLCDQLITRPEESYRLCCVIVCDLETSRIGAVCCQVEVSATS